MARLTSADFPVGFLGLHDDPSINFQMNRLYAFSNDTWLLAAMQAAAPRINGYDALVKEFTRLSAQELCAGHLLAAAGLARGADFYLPIADSRKPALRQRFRKLTLDAYGITEAEHHAISYQGAELSAYRLRVESPRGTLVFLNGFDGYIEELARLFVVFRDAGYDVIAFDGPGQGAVLEASHLPLTPEWERPVAAVLDHFDVADVTVIGCSLGGGLAIRAAAYEPRITRVICFDVLPDLLATVTYATPTSVQTILRTCLFTGTGRRLVNATIRRAAQSNLLVQWGIAQGMAVTRTASPYDFVRACRQFRTAPYSGRITQPVLLMAGSEDQYVPRTHLAAQLNTLTAAHSVTARMFTAAEHASDHCQIGNLGLAVQTMLDWLAKTPRT